MGFPKKGANSSPKKQKADTSKPGGFRRFCAGLYRFGKAVGARFDRTKLGVYAAQATYYVLFSSIPFLGLLFMAADRLFPKEIDNILDALRSVAPDLTANLPPIFWDTVLSVSVPTLSIAIISLWWAASKGMNAISAGLCAIYGSERGKNLFFRALWSMIYTVGLLAVLLFSLTLLVFGKSIRTLIGQYLPSLLPIVHTLFTLRGLIAIAVFSLVFTLCYKCMAARKWKLRSLLPGALFAGCGWILFSLGFSLYLKYFSNYSTLYGALGVLMVLMIWVHSCVTLLLLGAELNVFLAGSHIETLE